MSTTKQSNWGAAVRTTILLASLGGLLVLIGALIGGPSTAPLFLGIALLINLGSYFFSDKLALKMARAKPIEEAEAPRLYQIMRELTTRAGLPMPRMYMIPQEQPNAFATGRNPKNAAVAVTAGITKLLSEDELRGVLAHELAHIQHRHMLVGTLAAGRAGAIGLVASIAVSVGQKVTKGDKLLMMEAMKMQTTVTAPADGVGAELLEHGGQQGERRAIRVPD